MISDGEVPVGDPEQYGVSSSLLFLLGPLWSRGIWPVQIDLFKIMFKIILSYTNTLDINTATN